MFKEGVGYPSELSREAEYIPRAITRCLNILEKCGITISRRASTGRLVHLSKNSIVKDVRRILRFIGELDEA